MDPDYELSESVKEQAKEREHKEKLELSKRIRAILTKEFNSELKIRENQLEEIQNRITRVAKTLHLLRYVLVTSYYNHNEVQFQQTEDEPLVTDSQNRLHPAVKSVINSHYKFGFDSRRKSTRQAKLNEHMVIQESQDTTLKHVEVKEEEVVLKLPAEIVEDNIVPIRNRQMVKRRIVVGNISKWMPSDSPEDNSTHKWMVYVRGPKDNPNINNFVQKIVFYLHPSYQPNDVIELKDPPFHLSRRGWGEFPLRVQLFFHCTQNKPVDIIHNLKLDRTYTGRQTLGNETIVDVTIHSNKVNKNMFLIKNEVLDTININKEDKLNALSDHTYSLNILIKQEDVELEETSVLANKHKAEDELINEAVKKIKLELDEVITINYDKFRVKFPSFRFNHVVEALPYLLKRHPLITKLANNLDYKCTYSYVSNNLEQYSSWPIEKRQSSEWSRAKRILKILQSSCLNTSNWNTKMILAYARAHGFTELSDYKMFKDKLYPMYYIITESLNNFTLPVHKIDDQVDVEADEKDAANKDKKCNLIHSHLRGPCTFVKQAALDVGVVLKSEEIIPGILYNAAQRAILEATLCFAENLIRNARGLLVHSKNFSEEYSEIGVDEINTVLNQHRPEFKKILFFNKDAVKY